MEKRYRRWDALSLHHHSSAPPFISSNEEEKREVKQNMTMMVIAQISSTDGDGEEDGHGRDGELGDSSRSVSRRRAASLSRGDDYKHGSVVLDDGRRGLVVTSRKLRYESEKMRFVSDPSKIL